MIEADMIKEENLARGCFKETFEYTQQKLHDTDSRLRHFILWKDLRILMEQRAKKMSKHCKSFNRFV